MVPNHYSNQIIEQPSNGNDGGEGTLLLSGNQIHLLDTLFDMMPVVSGGLDLT